MLAYSMVGSNDIDKARKFYGELLGEIGAKEMMVRPDGGARFSGAWSRGDRCLVFAYLMTEGRRIRAMGR